MKEPIRLPTLGTKIGARTEKFPKPKLSPSRDRVLHEPELYRPDKKKEWSRKAKRRRLGRLPKEPRYGFAPPEREYQRQPPEEMYESDETPKPSVPALPGFAVPKEPSPPIPSRKIDVSEKVEYEEIDKTAPAKRDSAREIESAEVEPLKLEHCAPPEYVYGELQSSPYRSFFELSCKALERVDVLNVKCLKAKGNGEDDDTDVLMHALKLNEKKPQLIIIPAGVYRISKTLKLNSIKILGSPRELGETIIKLTDNVDLDRMVESYGEIYIEDIQFDANHRAQTGFFLSNVSSVMATIRNVSVKNALGNGIQCKSSYLGVLDTVTAEGNGGDGLRIKNCSAHAFNNIISKNNGGHGIHIIGDPQMYLGITEEVGSPMGPDLSFGRVSNNGKHGIMIDGVMDRPVIQNFCIETKNDGIQVEGEVQYCNFLGNRFRKMDSENMNAKMIRLGGTVSGCFIQDNALSDDEKVKDHFGIEIEGVNNVVMGNSILGDSFSPVAVNFSERNMVIPFPSGLKAPIQFGSGDEMKKRYVAFRKTPPETGRWRKGDVIFNGSEIAPYGWFCSSDSKGHCDWTPLSTLSPLLQSEGVKQ